MKNAHPRNLFFAPYAGIVEHSNLEYSVISALKGDGGVRVLRCRGVLPFPCSTIDARLGATQGHSPRLERRVCSFCKTAGDRMVEASGVQALFLEDFVSADDVDWCKSLTSSLSRSEWGDLQVEGVHVGRHAAYLGLIRAKAAGPEDLETVWSRYKVDLEASLVTLLATRRILAAGQFERALTFGGLYGPERTFLRVAASLGVSTVVLEGSLLSQELHSVLHAFPSEAKYDHAVFGQEWKLLRNEPIDRVTFKRVQKHQESLLTSSSPLVYSVDRDTSVAPDAVRRQLSIPPSAPMLLLLLSSPDELVAREFSIEDWPESGHDSVSVQAAVVDLTVQFARGNPDVHVVVRLHPRLFGNRRSRVVSPALEYFTRMSEDLPTNVHINHPDQGLSIYDVALVTDAALVHQSTSGLELLALGLPLIAAGPWLFTYPLDLTFRPLEPSYEAFEAVALEALSSPASLDRVRMAYRWWGFVSNYNRIDGSADTPGRQEASRPKESKSLTFSKATRSLLSDYLRKWAPERLLREASLLRLRGAVKHHSDALRQGDSVTKERAIGVIEGVAQNRTSITRFTQLDDATERRLLELQFLRMTQLLGLHDSEVGKLAELARQLRGTRPSSA